jgi:RNA-directed DNA polymerase
MPLEERRRQMVEQCEETPPAPSSGETVTTKLHRIARKARSDPRLRFTSLYHLMSAELLRECFGRLRGDAAAGIDRVTKAEYAEQLDTRLTDLVDRLQRMAYIPQPVRRIYIPKPGSAKRRPLGIPTLEDKLMQSGLAEILGQVYEQDFIADSYGFRPSRSCHDALRALSRTVEKGSTNWIVEADIKGFFDHVDHDWMMRFLAHRIGDKRVLRMIKRYLKAGVMENGQLEVSDEGTPQGGVLSPLLANIYLHYTLDLWFERRFRQSCIGPTRLIRYADDFVVCFDTRADAERFRRELIERLAQFNLEVEPSKTKILAFGPRARDCPQAEGKRKPETFDFLGFTHYCSRTRDGRRFRMKRITSRKRFRAKIAAFKEWLKTSRAHQKTREFWLMACLKIRGHYAYYGVTDNSEKIARFGFEARRLLFKWLNRRGGKRRMTWEKLALMERRFPLPQPRIVVNLF